jgi:hypothetical protein
MKKEIFIGVLLLLMIAGSIINMVYLNKITDDLIELILQAEECAQNDDWENALSLTEQAYEDWKSKDDYTHIMLRHSEINNTSNFILELRKEILNREKGAVSGAAKSAISHIEEMAYMEQIRIGTIF